MSVLTMTVAEREAFLADLHVGVFSAGGGDGDLVTVPIWYSYDPGGAVKVIMGRHSLKAQAIVRTGRMSLCAQQEALPYRYVSVEGPVASMVGPASVDERRAMAVRYLGDELAAMYLQSTEGTDNVVVLMTAEHWRTTDYGKQFG
jgi:hypothetical protein